MTEKRYSVPDVSCGHCKMAIEKAVGAMGGVSRVEVDVESKSVEIVFDEGQVAEGAILAVLEDEGYPVAR
ncbi:MAG: copper ion binding protein [Actinobacteria bacterium]|nr:copper ion binding protein [Actinomycetota bacterium]